MLLKREGFPEESDLVLCTVNNIQHNSIFVNIHEYDRQGMITISEIAPGRIRNIRDYVVEGKVVVCKVLNVNKERGYIDLSLRRVSEGQRREKSDEIKQEQKAEKIIEIAAHSLKIPFPEFYKIVAGKLLKQYFYIYQAFDDVVNGSIELSTFFDPKVSDILKKTILEKIKPKQIIVAGDIMINLWEENGVATVREIFSHAKDYPETKVSYMGGGNYRIIVKGKEYKDVEKILKEFSDNIISAVKKHKGKSEYARVKNLSTETEA